MAARRVQAEVWWGDAADRLDLLSQVHERTVRVEVLQQATARRLRITTHMRVRHFTYQELTLLAELSGFKVRLGRHVVSALCAAASRLWSAGLWCRVWPRCCA